jgi:hypothetical protein
VPDLVDSRTLSCNYTTALRPLVCTRISFRVIPRYRDIESNQTHGCSGCCVIKDRVWCGLLVLFFGH